MFLKTNFFLRRSFILIFVGSLSREAGIKIAVFVGKGPKFQSIRSEKALFCRSDWLKFGTLPQKYRTLLDGARIRSSACSFSSE